MTPADAEEYTQALGQVVAGGWRQIALGQRLGVPKALGLTVEQWVQQRLGGYVKYSIAERRQAVAELKADGENNTAIAAMTGVDEGTIRNDLKAMSENSETLTDEARNASAKANQSDDSSENSGPLDTITGLVADDTLRAAVDRRTKRETIAAAKRQVDLPTDKFRVIYADPPWSYHDKADAGAVQSGGAEQHYPSMSTVDLCALPISAICEANAVLFLWTPTPLIEDAFLVITAWGFTYKTHFIWDKHAHNRGHYNSVRHELLMLAVRGSCLPDVPKLYDSVQKAGRTEHSEKPGVFRIIIDTLYPYGKRVELFARERVEGWDAWGNEVEQ